MLLLWLYFAGYHLIKCEFLDKDPVEVQASGKKLPPNEPQYVFNRTCNAYRLYAIDNRTNYDHFQNERCGRYVSHLVIRRSIIRYIPNNFFIHFISFENLTTLKMDNISILAIYPNNFENITKLELLSISLNHIEHIPSRIFKHLPIIKEVDLSSNLIGSIDADAFDNCQHLWKIQLNGNRLIAIDDNWFKNLIRLEYLDLSDNIIAGYLNGIAFESATNLQLFARNNRISWLLNVESDGRKKQFLLIDLTGNALQPPYPIVIGNRDLRIIY